MGKSVLVIAAHPDDEVLGCGGTMARHADEGYQVHVLILAEGVTSRGEKNAKAKLAALGKAAQAAARALGVKSLTLQKFPDNRMDSVDLLDIVTAIETMIRKVEPEIVYTHHAGDVNVDHRRIHEAAVAACRPLPGQCVRTLLFFEVASSTEWQTPGSGPSFHPNWFVNISGTLDRKKKALQAYEAEMRKWPHARSPEALEHLARWRGANVGVNAAEAFVLGRNSCN